MAILFVTYSMVNITLKFIFSCNSSYKVGFKGEGSRDADPPTELLYLFFPEIFKISFQIFLISKLRLGALIGRSCLSSCLSVSLLLKLRILLKLGNVSRNFFLNRKVFQNQKTFKLQLGALISTPCWSVLKFSNLQKNFQNFQKNFLNIRKYFYIFRKSFKILESKDMVQNVKIWLLTHRLAVGV